MSSGLVKLVSGMDVPGKLKVKGFPDDLEHLLLKVEEGNESCVCNQVPMVDDKQYVYASVF